MFEQEFHQPLTEAATSFDTGTLDGVIAASSWVDVGLVGCSQRLHELEPGPESPSC